MDAGRLGSCTLLSKTALFIKRIPLIWRESTSRDFVFFAGSTLSNMLSSELEAKRKRKQTEDLKSNKSNEIRKPWSDSTSNHSHEETRKSWWCEGNPFVIQTRVRKKKSSVDQIGSWAPFVCQRDLFARKSNFVSCVETIDGDRPKNIKENCQQLQETWIEWDYFFNFLSQRSGSEDTPLLDGMNVNGLPFCPVMSWDTTQIVWTVQIEWTINGAW